jgi:hypothetical protein
MNIDASNAVLTVATAMTQSETTQAAQMLLLKKAMELQAVTAQGLLATLPDAALAAEGNLGTQLNTWA